MIRYLVCLGEYGDTDVLLNFKIKGCLEDDICINVFYSASMILDILILLINESIQIDVSLYPNHFLNSPPLIEEYFYHFGN